MNFLDSLSDNYSQITVPLEAMLMAINRITNILAIINIAINVVTQTENANHFSMP